MWWQTALAAAVVGFVMAQTPSPPGASAEIRDGSGKLVATTAFREGTGEVLVSITFPQPPVLSGAHAIHINDTGRCDPPGFATSGNILNPFNKQHGRNNPEGAEVGDLPNVNFSTGLTSYNTTAIDATLGEGPGSLLNPPRAILIYSGTDDQQTPPDGNAGTPVACGVIVAGGNGVPSRAPAAVSAASPVAPAAVARPTVAPAAVARPTVAPAVVARRSVVPAVAVAKPVAASASPSPIPGAAAPTPVIIQPTPVAVAASTQAAPSASGPNPLNIGVIAVLGLALIGSGVLLRRSSAQANQ